MDDLAKALLALDWADMDEFASHIASVSVDDNGEANDAHWIAGSLVDWARDQTSD